MDEIIYLTLEQVLLIHEDQIERYGGTSELRDLTLLESAIFRPQSTFAGEDLYKNHFEKAAALFHSLLLNHAFIDGNKRTATASLLTYLEFNHINIQIELEELVEVVLLVEKEKWNIEKIADWLKNKAI